MSHTLGPRTIGRSATGAVSIVVLCRRRYHCRSCCLCNGNQGYIRCYRSSRRYPRNKQSINPLGPLQVAWALRPRRLMQQASYPEEQSTLFLPYLISPRFNLPLTSPVKYSARVRACQGSAELGRAVFALLEDLRAASRNWSHPLRRPLLSVFLASCPMGPRSARPAIPPPPSPMWACYMAPFPPRYWWFPCFSSCPMV